MSDIRRYFNTREKRVSQEVRDSIKRVEESKDVERKEDASQEEFVSYDGKFYGISIPGLEEKQFTLDEFRNLLKKLKAIPKRKDISIESVPDILVYGAFRGEDLSLEVIVDSAIAAVMAAGLSFSSAKTAADFVKRNVKVLNSGKTKLPIKSAYSFYVSLGKDKASVEFNLVSPESLPVSPNSKRGYAPSGPGLWQFEFAKGNPTAEVELGSSNWPSIEGRGEILEADLLNFFKAMKKSVEEANARLEKLPTQKDLDSLYKEADGIAVKNGIELSDQVEAIYNEPGVITVGFIPPEEIESKIFLSLYKGTAKKAEKLLGKDSVNLNSFIFEYSYQDGVNVILD